MKTKELRKLKKEELENKANETSVEISNLYFDIQSGKSNKSAKLKALKKDFARIKTVLNEKLILEALNNG